MNTVISLPDATLARVDVAARRLGLTRSEFLLRAAEGYLDRLDATDSLPQAIGS